MFDPVPHLVGELFPFAGVLHHLLAAGLVIAGDGDLLPDVFLGDTQHVLHAQLHRESVGIPPGFAVDAVTLECLVAAYDILDGAGHHMVDSRLAVGRRGTFVKYKRQDRLPGSICFS